MTAETLFPEPVAPHLEDGFSFIYHDKAPKYDARNEDISTESRLEALWFKLMEAKMLKHYTITLRVTPDQYTRALNFCQILPHYALWTVGEYTVKLKI